MFLLKYIFTPPDTWPQGFLSPRAGPGHTGRTGSSLSWSGRAPGWGGPPPCATDPPLPPSRISCSSQKINPSHLQNKFHLLTLFIWFKKFFILFFVLPVPIIVCLIFIDCNSRLSETSFMVTSLALKAVSRSTTQIAKWLLSEEKQNWSKSDLFIVLIVQQ